MFYGLVEEAMDSLGTGMLPRETSPVGSS